ncbi:hypothetical protein [Sinomonas atrocyanea]
MEDAQMAQGLARQSGAAAPGREEAALLFGTALERVRVFHSLHGRLPEPAGAGEQDEPILGAWLDHQRHRRATDGLPPWKDNELTRALGSMWWSGEEDGGTRPLPFH